MPDPQTPAALQDTVRLPCPSCGSELQWSAEHKQIVCDYCGYREEMDHSRDKVVEQSLADAAAKMEDFVPEAVNKKVFDCQNCGAHFMVESDKVAVNCGFCGSQNINLEAYAHQYIQPVGIIPFYVSRDEAERLFKAWIKRGWFRPNALKRGADLDRLHGIYIPFWTYDAQTESDWEGEAGTYYYETRTVRVNGKMTQQRVRRTRWRWHSGHLSHFFDDVLIPATQGLNHDRLERITPYRLPEVVNYDPRLLVGWESEIYGMEVDEGYQLADRQMEHLIRNMCSAQLGGDTQRNLRVNSTKFDQTFKHIILPVWLSSYQFGGKTYHFSINGQTGKLAGDKPYSWVKITLAVLFVLLLIGAFVYLNELGYFDGGGPRMDTPRDVQPVDPNSFQFE